MLESKDLKWMREIYNTEKLNGWKVEIDKIGEEWRVKVVIYRKDWQHPFEWNAWFSEFKNEVPLSLFKKTVIYEAFKFCFAEELEKFKEMIPEKEVLEEGEERLERESLEEKVGEEKIDKEKKQFKEEFLEKEFYQEYEEPLYERSFKSLEEYLDKEIVSEEPLEKSYELELEMKPEEEHVEEPEVFKTSVEEFSSKEPSLQQNTSSKEVLEEYLEEHLKIKKPAKITLEQMQLIAKLLPNKSHKQRLKKISRIIGREVNTYGEISYEEAEMVIMELQGVKG